MASLTTRGAPGWSRRARLPLRMRPTRLQPAHRAHPSRVRRRALPCAALRDRRRPRDRRDRDRGRAATGVTPSSRPTTPSRRRWPTRPSPVTRTDRRTGPTVEPRTQGVGARRAATGAGTPWAARHRRRGCVAPRRVPPVAGRVGRRCLVARRRPYRGTVGNDALQTDRHRFARRGSVTRVTDRSAQCSRSRRRLASLRP